MIFGHLPAGYITSKLLLRKFQNQSVNANIFIFLGMSGAIAPDIDLLYYLLMDPSQPQQHHHTYLTHFPIFWLILLLISFVWLLLHRKNNPNAASFVIFAVNGFIHIVLDTITGHILWLAPLINQPSSLIADSSKGVSYFTHWTFGLEIFLILFALFVWLTGSIKKRKKNNSIT